MAPYAKGQGPAFSVHLWDIMQAVDHYPFAGMVRFGYRLSMDGQLLFEAEDYICTRLVAADPVRALDGILSFVTDESFVGQIADEIALRATTVDERDQYARLLAYLPHCEALRRESVAVLSDMVR